MCKTEAYQGLLYNSLSSTRGYFRGTFAMRAVMRIDCAIRHKTITERCLDEVELIRHLSLLS